MCCSLSSLFIYDNGHQLQMLRFRMLGLERGKHSNKLSSCWSGQCIRTNLLRDGMALELIEMWNKSMGEKCPKPKLCHLPHSCQLWPSLAWTHRAQVQQCLSHVLMALQRCSSEMKHLYWCSFYPSSVAISHEVAFIFCGREMKGNCLALAFTVQQAN